MAEEIIVFWFNESGGGVLNELLEELVWAFKRSFLEEQVNLWLVGVVFFGFLYEKIFWGAKDQIFTNAISTLHEGNLFDFIIASRFWLFSRKSYLISSFQSFIVYNLFLFSVSVTKGYSKTVFWRLRDFIYFSESPFLREVSGNTSVTPSSKLGVNLLSFGFSLMRNWALCFFFSLFWRFKPWNWSSLSFLSTIWCYTVSSSAWTKPYSPSPSLISYLFLYIKLIISSKFYHERGSAKCK